MPNTGRSKIVRDSDSEEAQFLKLSGQPIESGMEVEPWLRPGVDGLGGFIRMGKRGRPFTMIGMIDFTSMSSASSAGTSIIGKLKGEPCSIYDSAGNEHPDMLCLDVRPREPKPVLAGVGGLSNPMGAIIEIEMDFVARK